MRNHPAKLALTLLLAVLAEPGCSHSGEDPNTANKDNTKAQAEKARSGAATSDNPGATATKGQTRKSTDPTQEPQQPIKDPDDTAKTAGSPEPIPAPPLQTPAWWLSEPKVVGLIGLLIFLGLALHIVHILNQSRFKKEFAELSGAVQMLSQRVSIANMTENYGKAVASNELTQRLNRHRQGLDQLSAQINAAEQRVTASEQQAAEASTAVALAAHLAGRPRINHALRQAGAQSSEADRATAIKIVERYEEILGANEARTKPLIQETCDFAQWLNGRSNLPPELTARMEELRSDVLKFEQWHSNVSERLTSLKRGSVSDRYSTFRASHAGLAQQFNARAISIADYVKGYGELLERHFPAGTDGSVSIAPSEHEAELREIAAGVPDYLMDWLDRLSQLQAQAAQAAINGETAARLAQIQRTAKDVLGKFDIQPEEIQVGVTVFDRRLHDASLITQAPQYPANTVVGVQQYGFRKLSTGDVLRRPKVIVVGVGAA